MTPARAAAALTAVAAMAVAALLVLRGGDPVREAANRVRSAHLAVDGERSGRAVRGSGAVDLIENRARMEISESARGLEHEAGEGTELVFIGDRVYTRPRFLEYDDEGEISRWHVSPVREDDFDPRALVRDLRAAEDVRELGEERVRRTPTTHYRARARGGETVDVWIDEDGHVIQVRSKAMSVFFSYGDPVHISQPDLEDATPY